MENHDSAWSEDQVGWKIKIPKVITNQNYFAHSKKTD